jgi:hypothetical protein
MKHFVWMSFDLGVRGDYEGLYAWLDSKEAKECGEGLACFWFEHSTNKLIHDLKEELSSHVRFDEKSSRLYVIRLVGGKMKGKFIFGRRRTPPWTGYGSTGENDEDTASE